MDVVLFGIIKKIKTTVNNIKSELANKLDKNQGIENSGKIAGINESGNIIPVIPSGVTYNEETNCLEYGVDEKINLNAGIKLDDTLSKVGYAADAAKVGELKGDLADKLDKPDTAPSVGKILKVTAVNEDGSFVCEWADGGGDVTDVQIDGTSIVGENGVAEIPIANSTNLGLAIASGYGIQSFNGDLALIPSSEENINNRNSGEKLAIYGGLTNGKIDYAVKAAMCDGKGPAWTDTEKTGSWSRLTSIKNTMDEVAVAGANYLLGEQTEVTVVLPDDALPGQMVNIVFYNGETPATLSIMGNTLDFDFTPEANTRSEISSLWDGTYWSVIGMSQDVPVEEVVASE